MQPLETLVLSFPLHRPLPPSRLAPPPPADEHGLPPEGLPLAPPGPPGPQGRPPWAQEDRELLEEALGPWRPRVRAGSFELI